jgi:hypothetical protein
MIAKLMSNMGCWLRYALIVLVAISSLDGANVSFSLSPSDGRISGQPGETIGWGYSLFNEDSSEWFVPTGVSSAAFSIGSPGLLFDFPVLPPSLGVTVPFNWPSFQGLYSLSLYFDAPVGAEIAGTFALEGQWWSGDPFSGGAFLRSEEALVGYVATVTSVPEPSCFGAVLLALGTILFSMHRGTLIGSK